MVSTASLYPHLPAERLQLAALSAVQQRQVRGLGWALHLLQGGQQKRLPLQRAYLGSYGGQLLLLGTETLPQLSRAWLQLLADFHQPAQRQRWVQQLRRARYQRLLRLLPRAYLVAAEPLPPGAVLAGLGLASWQLLPTLQHSGHSFYSCQPDGTLHCCLAGHTAAQWAEFSSLLQPGTLLLQLPGQPPEQLLYADYELTGAGRICLQE